MNILTFDIEDLWVYDHYKIGNKEDYIPRLDSYLNQILDLLDERGFKATFFCLGIMAERYPEVIKLIADRGHQIGCHSYGHQFLSDVSREEFEEDTCKAISILENIAGNKVTAYRAPAFSISEKNKWALEVLAQNGILFDCSIFPAIRSFGGFPSYNTDRPAIVKYNGITMKEFPISLTDMLGKRIAYSGGGYFRLFPYSKINKIINRSDYVMTYFHLRDFDKEQERKTKLVDGENLILRYFKNYYGLNSCFSKFEKLIRENEFVSLERADTMIDWNKTDIINV
ncbi:DUF3473 domain-containing protein [Puteibacter caeruleilacunae]|nr:DUF3473 domain-containing protein [Puteibacter caeruleilacunae]